MPEFFSTQEEADRALEIPLEGLENLGGGDIPPEPQAPNAGQPVALEEDGNIQAQPNDAPEVVAALDIDKKPAETVDEAIAMDNGNLEIGAPGQPSPLDGGLNVDGFMHAMQTSLQPNEIHRGHELSPQASQANTLPVNMPEGTTAIHPDDMMPAVQALANNFTSMNEVGILLDPQDRVMYGISVMSNDKLRSDIKAQLIDQAMRDGKIVPQALSRDWYEARNLILKPINPGGF